MADRDSSAPTKSRIVVGLLIIAAVNLAVDVGMVVYLLQRLSGTAWLSRLFFAVPFGQVFLLGFWLGLGDGKWYWRVVFTVPMAMCVGYSVAVAALLSPAAGRHSDVFWQSNFLVFTYIALVLASFVALLPLRLFRGWRLTWNPASRCAVMRQFQIGDLLLWMLLIGCVLGTGRFLVSLDNTVGRSLAQFSVHLTAFAVVTLIAMVAAFQQTRRVRTWLLLAGVLMLIASTFSIYECVRVANLVRLGMPWSTLRMVFQALAELAAFPATAAVAFANGLALCWLGCRLVRPGDSVLPY